MVSHEPCVRRVPIFAGLTPDEQDAIAELAHSITLGPGAMLGRRGDRRPELFVVHAGRVKISQVTPSGHQRLLRVAGPGDVVGEHAFLTGERSDDLVEALEEAKLCSFRASDLGRVVADHPTIVAAMLRSLSQRLSDAERRLALVSVEVPVRLADFLLELPTLGADGAGGDGIKVRLPWPKKDVASYLGTTPESVSRALERLQVLGLIAVSGPVVELVDPEGLEELAEGAQPSSPTRSSHARTSGSEVADSSPRIAKPSGVVSVPPSSQSRWSRPGSGGRVEVGRNA